MTDESEIKTFDKRNTCVKIQPLLKENREISVKTSDKDNFWVGIYNIERLVVHRQKTEKYSMRKITNTQSK